MPRKNQTDSDVPCQRTADFLEGFRQAQGYAAHVEENCGEDQEPDWDWARNVSLESFKKRVASCPA